jgi:Sec-independent protein translocase protein TatA
LVSLAVPGKLMVVVVVVVVVFGPWQPKTREQPGNELRLEY